MNKWRFPSNNYGPENGLDTSDMETFKKDPEGSLAREICQNSIDAQFNQNIPVRVEFKVFTVDKSVIPGIEDLEEQITRCYDYKKDSKKEEKSLKLIKENIGKQAITCLRISDFNTTGLLGVKTNARNQPFYNLTKGSGISDKQGTSGGSKGIGKFASFVASSTNTVFYSTKTKDDECGYIGITKLRSAPIPGKDEDAFTQGIGYYALDEKNYPILNELCLDKNFSRNDTDYGTDLFIIGFNDKNNWISSTIAKVLDSFMYAIMQDRLNVIVDRYEVNKDNLYKIIYDYDVLSSLTPATIKRIKAQYELLTDESVSSDEFDIDNYGKIKIYVKSYNSQNSKQASNRCEMIRYPYMKINHKTGFSYLSYSAMCIIDDSKLNEKLRLIENPQHTDWEIKRLNDYPEEKKVTKKILKKIEETIRNYVETVLSEDNADSTDLEGAGYYLPAEDVEGLNEGAIAIKDAVKISKIKKNKVTKPKTVKIDDNGESYDVSTGELVDGEADGRTFHVSDGVNPNPDPVPGPSDDKDKNVKDGDKKILKRSPLNGTKFRTIIKDRTKNEYDIVFTSQYNSPNCELELKQLGDTKDRYNVNVKAAEINGKICNVENGKIIGFEIKKGKKYKITCTTDIDDLFSSEVILNAIK